MVQEILNDVSDKLDILKSMPKEINNKIKELDKEQNDIVHTIEFSNFNAYEGWYLSKRIKEIRTERRKYKNILEEIDRTQGVMNIYNSSMKSKINKATKSIKKLNSIQDNRSYNTRVLSNNDDISKLKSVNKTNIKFKSCPERDRLEELFRQIESER